jgi:hypothetical protein
MGLNKRKEEGIVFLKTKEEYFIRVVKIRGTLRRRAKDTIEIKINRNSLKIEMLNYSKINQNIKIQLKICEEKRINLMILEQNHRKTIHIEDEIENLIKVENESELKELIQKWEILIDNTLKRILENQYKKSNERERNKIERLILKI